MPLTIISMGNAFRMGKTCQSVNSIRLALPAHSKIRYTRVKCLITRGSSGKSPRQSVAFFTSNASMDVGGESGNTSRLAGSRLLTPTSTPSLNNGVVVLKDSSRSNLMALAKSTATPTHNFVPKFKVGDICRLKNHKRDTELNGLTVIILAPLSVTTAFDFPHETWLGYETDLCYRDRWIYPRESQLVKIGERA